jgi:hypothetical protein
MKQASRTIKSGRTDPPLATVVQLSRKPRPIEKVIAGGVFHCTSMANLKLILETGAIHPNRGQFPSNHPLSPFSAVRRMGGISLFDLGCAGDRTDDFLSWLPQTNLAVQVNRDRIGPHIVNPRNQTKIKGVLLMCEVSCPVPIPVAFFAGYLLLGPSGSARYKLLKAGTDFETIAAEAEELATARKLK